MVPRRTTQRIIPLSRQTHPHLEKEQGSDHLGGRTDRERSTDTDSQVNLPGCLSQRKSNCLRSSREVWDQKGRHHRILSSDDSRVSNIHARSREARGLFYSDFLRL